jgi:hypothetical protein
MLTPSEAVGLAGQRLASRIQKAIDSIPPDEMRELLRSIHALATERHLAYDRNGKTETIRLFACPITLRQDQLAYLHYLSQTVHNAIKKLPDLYLSNPIVNEILRLSPEEDRWLREFWTPAHREANPIFGRLDAVVDFASAMWKESLQLLEPNLTGIGGIHLGPTSDRVLAERLLPAIMAHDSRIRLAICADIRELLLQEMLEHLEAIGRPNGRIALVDPKYIIEGPDEPEALVRYYAERHDLKLLHADPTELRLDGDEVYVGDQRIDLAYRDYTVLELLELQRKGGDVQPMRKLLQHNRVMSSISAELDQKSCWEVFTDWDLVARYFTVEERQVFHRHIPWTRLLSERRTANARGETVDLLEHVRQHREQLVIKPNRSYGGDGVLLGSSASQSDWEAAIQAALTDTGQRWVAQQLTPLPVKEFYVLDELGVLHLEPFYVVLGFAPSRYGVSLIARASQKQVVNVAQRGGVCAVMMSSSAVR